jgi:hypothetical protein
VAETNKPDTETDADPVIEADATEAEAASDPEDQPTETPTSEVKKSGGFMPALIGGFVAAALGFYAARTDVLDFILPGSTKVTQALDDLRGADTKQASDLAALRAELAAIDLPDLAPLNTQLAAVQTELTRLNNASEAQQAALSDLEARFAPLSSRLETLEKRPMTDGASDAAIAAYDRELAAMQQTIAEQRAEVAAMIDNARATEDAARALEQNAASTALKAQNQATIARLFGTLENGTPYAPILAELTAAGITIPPALNASANDGVPTLAALSDAFPAAARAALSATRAEGGEGGGLGGFLQRQLGARSLAPRQGADADAILSRAEAAATAGDLPTALDEIAALPDLARAQMQGWIDTATTRLTALQAANELAQSLNTN